MFSQKDSYGRMTAKERKQTHLGCQPGRKGEPLALGAIEKSKRGILKQKAAVEQPFVSITFSPRHIIFL
jgi:hypothetical protein